MSAVGPMEALPQTLHSLGVAQDARAQQVMHQSQDLWAEFTGNQQLEQIISAARYPPPSVR